jgi:hypothetical protein
MAQIDKEINIEREIVDLWLFDTKIMLGSVWKKNANKKRGRGNVGHDPMYLCFYDHNFPYVVMHFNFKNFFGFAHTRFIYKAAVVWGGQVVKTKIYFRFRHSTRPPSCHGKIRAAHFPADV